MTNQDAWRTVWTSPNERLIVQARDEKQWVRHRFVSNGEGNGAVVVAINDGKILFVQAPRPVISKTLWELPRGQADNIDKSPEETARREFEEETGLLVSALNALGLVYPDSGLCGDAVNVVMASVDSPDDAVESEYETLAWLSPAEIRQEISAGHIRDGISLSALMLAQSKKLI